MEPRVQYATTADGVRIAFSTWGEGRAFVNMLPIPFRHLQAEWQLPEERRWMERVGRNRWLVQYDPPGMGLSERNVAAYSLDAFPVDLGVSGRRFCPPFAAGAAAAPTGQA